ncbi:hypothetical protein AB833_06530 [Chromatiales bacterium (ex Bugula neritina AB1)]|nr:hypothetical protein AB833_06530 [Chromatiales bacterium (ex Bugula neritina AB1)]
MALALGLTVTDISARRQLNLPLMGEPADQVMSPRDELAIGRDYMRQIRQHLNLVSDSELNAYIQQLGERLAASQLDPDTPEFTFFVVENPEINAFALPGGFVGINTGLITAANNEAQLASVLAHETAHVLQRHIARLYASQGNTGLKTAATILAAILLGQQSAEAGQAALLTGIAASQQSAINFTRLHEYEADRIGIQLLTDAGYNPQGMVQFFEVLRRRIALSATERMEFLRTHPLTTNRISEARNNASRLANPIGVQDSIDFQIQQIKLKVLHSNDPHAMQVALAQGHISNSEPVRLYGRIVLLLKAGMVEDCLPLVERLNQLLGTHSAVRLLTARVAIANNDSAHAESIYSSLVDIQPDNYPATEQYLAMLSGQRRTDRAQAVIKHYLRNSLNPVPDVYRKYAEVLRQKGRVSAAHEATADYFFSTNDPREAIIQLELALRSVEKQSNEEARISARIMASKNKLRRNY